MVEPGSTDEQIWSHTYDESNAVVYYLPGDPSNPGPDISPYDTDSDASSIFSQHSASTLSSQEARACFQDVGGRLYPVDPQLPIFMPQDEQESHRLDREHLALKLVLGRNCVGPVASHLRYDPLTPRKRVLDIGTQQGTWVQEMAAEFPHVDFVSLDFAPMTPHIPRGNITFEVYDLYAGLAEADASFDMVHIRHTANKTGNYYMLLRELHRVLRPGGLFISGEFENEIYEASNPDVPIIDPVPRLSRGLAFVRRALAAQGVTVDAGQQLPGILSNSNLFRPAPDPIPPLIVSDSDSDSSGASFSSAGSSTYMQSSPLTSELPTSPNPLLAGFTEITPFTYYLPATPWPDPQSSPYLHQAGQLSLLGLRRGWPSLVPLLTVHAGLSNADAEEIVTGALEDHFVDPTLKLIMKYHTVWAFKVSG